MRLTKYTHACVTLEQNGTRIVIDPGMWAEDEAFEGVSAVLITHEHGDHFDLESLREWTARDSAAVIYGPDSVTAQLTDLGDRVITVAPDEYISVGDFSIRTVGGLHAEIIDGLPGCPNIGYVVNDNVYHPGDAFFIPTESVRTALVPTSGPWLKLSESIEFIRALTPVLAFSIHDALLNDIATGMVDRWLEQKSGAAYERAVIGLPIDL
jgi:L-ascorbate metabolism protein UlaG (beta-lactamase superfamily)